MTGGRTGSTSDRPATTSRPATAGAPLVRLGAVDKRFDNGTHALHGFDLAVDEHSFVSLLGPSGCGKTTVLRIVAGLAAASAGRVDWRDGRRPTTSFVFQEPTLMPWARVGDNVRLPLRLARGPIDRDDAPARVAAALAAVGLADAAEAWPRQLSGGMKMRVSIARAMITRPALLLMDEPFAALDEITRFRLVDDTLALWHARRFTTLFVTHSVFESVYMSQRIVVMSPGPGRVAATFRIDEPYPRDPSFRLTPRYAAWCGQVSQALARAADAAPAAPAAPLAPFSPRVP